MTENKGVKFPAKLLTTCVITGLIGIYLMSLDISKLRILGIIILFVAIGVGLRFQNKKSDS